MSDPNDRLEQRLQQDIHRFPHLYPASVGGTGRETITPADRLLDSQLPDETGHPEFSIENDTSRPTDNGWCEDDN
jgi:hypothetical protein